MQCYSPAALSAANNRRASLSRNVLTLTWKNFILNFPAPARGQLDRMLGVVTFVCVSSRRLQIKLGIADVFQVLVSSTLDIWIVVWGSQESERGEWKGQQAIWSWLWCRFHDSSQFSRRFDDLLRIGSHSSSQRPVCPCYEKRFQGPMDWFWVVVAWSHLTYMPEVATNALKLSLRHLKSQDQYMYTDKRKHQELRTSEYKCNSSTIRKPCFIWLPQW